MNHFTSVHDVANINSLVQTAFACRQQPFSEKGKNKMVGLIFMNPSLRTRLSSQIAARNLGCEVMVMNLNGEGWKLELNDGTIMNGDTVEHIRDAAAVMGSYCDIIGIRSFAKLESKQDDYSEQLINSFREIAGVPIISLESATLHPLQSLADLITIRDNWKESRSPKIVLAWGPHVKALPQAVANSFAQWTTAANYPLTIACPDGYNLSDDFTAGATTIHNLDEALQEADFVYVKNWSSYEQYGRILSQDSQWMLNLNKWQQTNEAKVMHCLPVRRNLELSAELLDSPHSLVQQQAANRVWAAQAVMQGLL